MLTTTNGKTWHGRTLDENLIFRIAANDKHALESLYVETKTAVYGFILSIVRNSYTAEDIMQETYIKIFASASGYVARGKPMAWILKIARNLSLMKLREKSSSELPLDLSWGAARVECGLETSLDRMVLDAAMLILSDDERQIIILHDIAGMKHREISDILKIPLPTVLSKYRRSLSKLRQHMKEGARDE